MLCAKLSYTAAVFSFTFTRQILYEGGTLKSFEKKHKKIVKQVR